MDDHRIHTIVPRLRFPDFLNDGEWEVKRLGELFVRITDRNVENDRNVLTISAQYGLVNQFEYFSKNVAASDVTNYYIIKKGDFAYNKSRSQGYPFGAIKPLLLYDIGVVSTLYICFRLKDECRCDADFYRFYFDMGIINDQISNIAQEGARNHGLLNISTDDFFNINILVPPLDEQRRIAACLSVLDEMLAATNARLGQLKAYKKSLMQKLFPAKGKKLPELRFKEFEKDGEWEEKELCAAAKVKSGYAFRSNTYTQTGRYKIITISNVKNGYLDLTSNNFVEHLPEDIQPHQILKKGDILISMTGNVGRVCKVCCDNCLLNQRVGLVDVYSSDVDRNYIYTILTSDWFEKSMIESGQGAAQANIGNKDIEGYRFFCPPTLSEQRKIADSVTSIDEMINQYVNKVTLLELYKKGLMQQLFPTSK